MPEGDTTSGILKLSRQSSVLIDAVRAGDEVTVPRQLVQVHGLVEGATVAGPVRRGRQGVELAGVTSVCGVAPAAFQARPAFDRLVAVDPSRRFNLAAGGEPSMRAMDLIAPIGQGTRGLVAAPPKAGKTTVLEQIARGIRADQPDARIVVLLVDERPEEMTYFRRTVSAEVFASSSDRPVREHTELCELMLAHARTELECGHHVVILMDSLTRLARAFNLRGTPAGSGGGRTLSGGIEAGALEVPRRFFGLARNIENGGSVTLIATILIETGSRMDQVIYEEFKATGNSELVLNREMAQERIYPAIDIAASGTRKEELLYGPDEWPRLVTLRRLLAGKRPREAMLDLLKLLSRYPTNAELLQSLPPSF